jgi:hypothetical protein
MVPGTEPIQAPGEGAEMVGGCREAYEQRLAALSKRDGRGAAARGKVAEVPFEGTFLHIVILGGSPSKVMAGDNDGPAFRQGPLTQGLRCRGEGNGA